MKKFLLLLLAVFFVFSCKVSLNDARASLAANIKDDDEEPVEEDSPDLSLDDEYLTSFAKEKGAIMFVSDNQFFLTVGTPEYNLVDYKGISEGHFYFSDNAQDWEDLYEYYGIEEVALGNITGLSNSSNLFISSRLDEDLGKYVVYFRGLGLNKAFKLRFINITDHNVGCYGNIVDLIASDAEDKENYELGSFAFYNVFWDFKTLTHAPELPSKNLSEYCYLGMFNGCESLKSAPALPVTDLSSAGDCYSSMFMGCTSLKEAPELPATILSSGCYSEMFRDCTSLKEAPELPATTLTDWCYSHMFRGCTSLEKAPKALPATQLTECCYMYMFADCTSLESAPEILPAIELTKECYSHMFAGCSSLKSAPALPATKLAPLCYGAMFYKCTSLRVPSELPATELYNSCYNAMFAYSGIESVPALPAIQLADSCYANMFGNCKNISEVDPDLLKATVLYKNCYNGMFSNSGINTPLKIKVKEIVDIGERHNCMASMFESCTNLSYILLPEFEGDSGLDIITRMNDIAPSMFFWSTKYISPRLNSEKYLSKYPYSDFALNQTKAWRVSNLPIKDAKVVSKMFYHNQGDRFDEYKFENTSTFFLDKEVKGYSREAIIPSYKDTTTFSSPDPFSISSPSGKTWDGVIRYWDGCDYIEWDGVGEIKAVVDCYSDDYVIYMVGDNSVISNGNAWKITGSNITLDLKLGALLSYSDDFIEVDGKKYREISVADNCFNAWFSGSSELRSGLKKVVIQNDPCSIVVLGKKSFYETFQISKIYWVDIRFNKDADTYLKNRLNELSKPLEQTFAYMFASSYVPESQKDISNINVPMSMVDDTTFYWIFTGFTYHPDPATDDPAPTPATDDPAPTPATDDPAPTPAKDDPAPTPAKDKPSEVKTATGSGKVFTPASGVSPKDYAKSGVKKPFPGRSAQEGVIRL